MLHFVPAAWNEINDTYRRLQAGHLAAARLVSARAGKLASLSRPRSSTRLACWHPWGTSRDAKLAVVYSWQGAACGALKKNGRSNPGAKGRWSKQRQNSNQQLNFYYTNTPLNRPMTRSTHLNFTEQKNLVAISPSLCVR